jgi:RimJ/RimL family protein N-acetyltransferase
MGAWVQSPLITGRHGTGRDVEIRAAAGLETPRLRLTAITEDDAEEMAVVLSDPRLHEYIGGTPLGALELRAQYRRWSAGSGNPDEVWLNWVVRLRATGEAIGFVQATVSRQAGGRLAAEVAWVTGVPWQGRGFAAEAAGALVAWLARVGVVDVTACIHPRHRASERVAERVGFTPTAVTFQGERVWRYCPPVPSQ